MSGTKHCRHGHPVDVFGFAPCGACPCPATGGRHVWVAADSGDAYAALGGKPGSTRVVTRVVCDECRAVNPWP